MCEFLRVHIAPVRREAPQCSETFFVKEALGMGGPIRLCINPRSTIAPNGGGSLGCPDNWPPRHVRSGMPSANEGKVPKNIPDYARPSVTSWAVASG